MVKLNHILGVLLGVLVLSSCNTYNVVAENDVYMQRPNKINVNEDPNDMTTYTAYKAGRNGMFRPYYNTSVFMGPNMYNPYYSQYGIRPYSHYGMHNPWRQPYGFQNTAYDYYGMNSWNNQGFSSGFGFGPGYNGYGAGYGAGCPNTFGSNTNFSGTSFNSNNTYYGHRSSLTSASGRSSNYPTTLKSIKTTNSNTKFTQSATQTKVVSRANNVNRAISTREVSSREVVRSNASRERSVRQTNRTTTNRTTARNNQVRSNNTRAVRPSTRSQSRLNSSYKPSNSAQRSGTVSRSQTRHATGTTPTRGTSIHRGSSTNTRVNSSTNSRSTGGSVSRGSSSRSSSGSSRSSSRSSSGGRR